MTPLLDKHTAARAHNAAYDLCQLIAMELPYAADLKAEREIIARIDAEIATLAMLRGYRLEAVAAAPADQARAA